MPPDTRWIVQLARREAAAEVGMKRGFTRGSMKTWIDAEKHGSDYQCLSVFIGGFIKLGGS